MKNKLFVLVGLPRSGKSTWAREACIGMNCDGRPPIVNPDSIRMVIHGTPFKANVEHLVWSTAHIMVESLFAAGHTEVILDACNHTKYRRNEWLSKDWDCECVEFKTSEQECVERAFKTDQQYLIPIIRRMSKEITWPNAS